MACKYSLYENLDAAVKEPRQPLQLGPDRTECSKEDPDLNRCAIATASGRGTETDIPA